MAKIVGRNFDVAISSADSSYTEIGSIKSSDMAIANDRADATDNDSAGHNEGEYSQSQRTCSVSGNYDKSDAGQLELQAAAEAKTKVWLRLRPTSSSGEREWRFQALIDDYTISGATADIEEFSFSATSDGTPVSADQ